MWLGFLFGLGIIGAFASFIIAIAVSVVLGFFIHRV